MNTKYSVPVKVQNIDELAEAVAGKIDAGGGGGDSVDPDAVFTIPQGFCKIDVELDPGLRDSTPFYTSFGLKQFSSFEDAHDYDAWETGEVSKIEIEATSPIYRLHATLPFYMGGCDNPLNWWYVCNGFGGAWRGYYIESETGIEIGNADDHAWANGGFERRGFCVDTIHQMTLEDGETVKLIVKS